MGEFKKLSDREHVLLRPAMYIGGVTLEKQRYFIDGKLVELSVVPGLLKITNELVDNCVDEYIRSNGKHSTEIEITVDGDFFMVKDNGRGIPVEKYEWTEDGKKLSAYRPYLAWCEARTGTSFDEKRVGPGANGVGSVVANCFSTLFRGSTNDGKNICTVECRNNMEDIRVTTNPKPRGTKSGTTVTMTPDFKRFGVNEYDKDHVTMLRERVSVLAVTYPKIKFIFNGKPVGFKNDKEYLSEYGNVFVSGTFQNGFFGVFPSEYDEYVQKSSIDGLDMRLGGTHESVFMHEICDRLKVIIKKQYKLDVSNAEIKRCLKLVMIGRNFVNMEFDSQTKERLTNSEKSVKEWIGEVEYDALAKKIAKTPDIINPIVQSKLAKQLAMDKRAVTLAQKKLASVKVKGYLKAQKQGSIDGTKLFIVEGLSAASGPANNRDPNLHGVFPIRGVPLNSFTASEREIVENKELKNILAITGLSLTSKAIDSLNYESIVIATDADVDGSNIKTLLFAFFSRWKSLFDTGRVKVLRTPLFIATKGKTRKYYFTVDEYELDKKSLKGYEIRYCKGLGTYRSSEISEFMRDDNFLESVELDTPEIFDVICGEDASKRKEFMRG